MTADELLAEADRHLAAASTAYKRNRLVNLRKQEQVKAELDLILFWVIRHGFGWNGLKRQYCLRSSLCSACARRVAQNSIEAVANFSKPKAIVIFSRMSYAKHLAQ